MVRAKKERKTENQPKNFFFKTRHKLFPISICNGLNMDDSSNTDSDCDLAFATLDLTGVAFDEAVGEENQGHVAFAVKLEQSFLNGESIGTDDDDRKNPAGRAARRQMPRTNARPNMATPEVVATIPYSGQKKG